MEAVEFQKKLEALLDKCKENGNVISKEEVEADFKEDKLGEMQMNLMMDYLLSQKIIVTGYKKNEPMENVAKEPVLTEEEQQYLERYEEELRLMPQTDPLAKILPQILEIAKELHQPGIFLGDLVQEGSMGLMIGLSQKIEAEEALIQMARENMQSLLEIQSEVKIQDQKMADKVNDLDEKIKEVTEQMGRKVSVEELSQLLEITEEEIEDIVRLAGEDLEEEKPAEP